MTVSELLPALTALQVAGTVRLSPLTTSKTLLPSESEMRRNPFVSVPVMTVGSLAVSTQNSHPEAVTVF